MFFDREIMPLLRSMSRGSGTRLWHSGVVPAYARCGLQQTLVAISTMLMAALISGCIGSVSAPEQPEGWETATPASVGLDGALLLELDAKLADGDFGQISSLLVARNGKLVYEQYLGGMTQTSPHAWHTATAAVTSMLVGISLARGEIVHPDVRVLSFFPNYDASTDTTGQKINITLRQVLQMRAGFEWNEFSSPYSSGQNPTSMLRGSRDWTLYILDLPIADTPGSQFTYNSGLGVLLGSVLGQVTGERISDIARVRLFQPLGITGARWDEGPANVTNTGWGLFLSPRGMASLGQLYLQNGTWGDKQIVRPDWIAASLQSYSELPNGEGFGYQWWIMNLGSESAPELVPYAKGDGGQFMFVSVRRNMVVVSTAEQIGDGEAAIRTILKEYLFR